MIDEKVSVEDVYKLKCDELKELKSVLSDKLARAGSLAVVMNRSVPIAIADNGAGRAIEP